MEYVVSASEMKKYDENTTSFYGIPSCVLMERAAIASVQEIQKRMEVDEKKVLVLAGCGNNGGDGIAIARLLFQKNAHVTVFFPGEMQKCTPLTRQQMEIYEKYHQKVTDHISNTEYDIIIDALFGIGLNRDLSGIYEETILKVNSMKGYHVAIDIPSGINGDTGCVMGIAFRADLTVTFGYKKRGQIFYPGAEHCGTLVCKEIGITEESFLGEHPQMYSYQPDDIERKLPKRRKDGNKGSFGKVLMITGSENMSGACVLSGLSAYRTGTGLVRIVTPMKNRSVVQKKLPEAVLQPYHNPLKDTDLEKIKKSIAWADSIAIGSGLDINEDAIKLVSVTLDELTRCEKGKTLVIDADALNIIAKDDLLKEKIKSLIRKKPILKETMPERTARKITEEKIAETETMKTETMKTETAQKTIAVIMTPHMGEFSRLTGKPIAELKKNIVDEILAFSNAYGVVLVCKDARTLCTDGTSIYINQSGNDGMATAGSGDVLTGIITALTAQGMNSMDASSLGVYLHGMAGDRACEKTGTYALMATDIIKQLKYMRKG